MSYNNQPQNRKPLPLTPFDVMSNWLFANPVQGSQKRPNLRIKVMGNVPRITVKTNVEGDKNYGKIDFNTDLSTFSVAMHKLYEMATGADTSDGWNFDYEDDFLAGKKLDNKIIITTLQIGRDKDTGRLYIALLSGDKSRPRIQFFFGPSKFHNIRRRDGSAITEKEMSDAYAIGFLKPACKLVDQLMITLFDENAKNVANPNNAPGGGNNNGGGGGNNNYQQNRGGNGGGGNQQRQAAPAQDFEDDIPDF